MLSRNTLRVVSLNHSICVLMMVSPFQFNAWNSGINGRCNVVYHGLFWKRIVDVQIIVRLLVAGLLCQNMLYNAEMMPIDIGLTILVVTILLTSSRLLHFHRSNAEELVGFFNQFLRLNQNLGKFSFNSGNLFSVESRLTCYAFVSFTMSIGK